MQLRIQCVLYNWHTFRRREVCSEWSEALSRLRSICSARCRQSALVTCFHALLDVSRCRLQAGPRPLSSRELQRCRCDQPSNWSVQDRGDRCPRRSAASNVLLEALLCVQENQRSLLWMYSVRFQSVTVSDCWEKLCSHIAHLQQRSQWCSYRGLDPSRRIAPHLTRSFQRLSLFGIKKLIE